MVSELSSLKKPAVTTMLLGFLEKDADADIKAVVIQGIARRGIDPPVRAALEKLCVKMPIRNCASRQPRHCRPCRPVDSRTTVSQFLRRQPVLPAQRGQIRQQLRVHLGIGAAIGPTRLRWHGYQDGLRAAARLQSEQRAAIGTPG